jgi:hypothetical protein
MVCRPSRTIDGVSTPDANANAMEIAKKFAAQVLGGVITEADPPVDSFLAKLQKLVDARDAGKLSAEEFDAAVLRLRRTT